MMHLFINFLAASAGGGLTYARNVIPYLATQPESQTTVAISPNLSREFDGFANINLLELNWPSARRFWYEQTRLSGLIRQTGADVLLSAGNFALRNSPVPQILLSRNSIYNSADFYRDLWSRHEYREWADTHFRAILAKWSICWADATVAPSQAFAVELSRWSGAHILTIPHGFDDNAFARDPTPLAEAVEAKLRTAGNSLKLLFVSHYNYYRNFETLIRALPLLRQAAGDRSVRLLLTCRLAKGENPGAYNPEGAKKLVESLGVSDMVIELGAIPYRQLHHLYRRADLYVTPAYTETFAHPLVEAMASGLPVVAADIPVHREICGDAAIYFPRFSPEELAASVMQLGASPETAKSMARVGRECSRQFSWKTHVEQIVELARTLVRR
jgi:glycosyltransferase involved in cell wall biosynthesis